MEVLKSNENAFLKRYGVSLSEIFDNSKDAVSSYTESPELSAQIRSMEIKLPEESKVLVIAGFQDGTFVQRLRKVSGYREMLIAEESKASFLYSVCKYDLSEIFSDSRILIWIEGISTESLEKAVEKVMQYHTIKHVFFIMHPEYDKHHREFADELWKIARNKLDYVETIVNSRVLFENGPCKNELQCISQLYNNSTVDQLFDAIPTREFPIIIVSAGPSLGKNVSELVNAYDRALIVVVAHAAEALERAGVRADFVAITDPENGTGYMDFDLNNKCRLIISGYGPADIQKKYNGRCVYLGFNKQLWPIKRIDSKLNPRLDAGSVATDMMSLFFEAGFRTFILIGQDLAYDENGFSHVGGEKEIRVYENDIFYVEGINGKTLKSRNDWVMFLEFFEKMIKEHDDITVIDATEGGALIHGSLVMTLREALDKFCDREYPIGSWIENLEKGDKEEQKEIEKILEAQLNKCIIVNDKLNRIGDCAEYVLSFFEGKEKDRALFSARCSEYDALYRDILLDDDAELVRYYCHDDIQLYLINALDMEGDNAVVERTRFEYDLFKTMYEKSVKLIEYIRGLNV